jgi:hypothetical protein
MLNGIPDPTEISVESARMFCRMQESWLDDYLPQRFLLKSFVQRGDVKALVVGTEVRLYFKVSSSSEDLNLKRALAEFCADRLSETSPMLIGYFPGVHPVVRSDVPQPVKKALGGINDVFYYEDQRSLDTVVRSLAVVGRGVCIAPSTIPGAGGGLFADKRFAAGELITMYEGVRMSHKECASLPLKRQSHARSLQLMRTCIKGIESTDPDIEGKGGASMVNDAVTIVKKTIHRDVEKINASFVKLQLLEDDKPIMREIPPERIHIAIFATKDIEEGDEILVDYGNQYWKRMLA